MIHSLTHEKCYEYLEEFVFGSLEPEFRPALDKHLQVCEKCRDRVAELGCISAMMTERLEQVNPPEKIRAALMQAAGIVPESAQLQSPTAHTAQTMARTSSRWPLVLTLAASVVLLFVSGNLWREQHSLRASIHEFSIERVKLTAELERYKDATILLGQAGMEFIDLNGVDPNPQAFGKVVLDPYNGTGVVYMYKLPLTPKGKEYKLWIMREGKPTSAGEFTVDNEGKAVINLRTLTDMTSIASFQVTIEDVGGAQLPTGMMYLTGPYTPASN